MKTGVKMEKIVRIRYLLGAFGVMERGSLENEVIALFRVSRSRRVVAVKVERKSGSHQEVIFTSLDRVLRPGCTPVSEKESFDLYLDSEGDKVQA